VDDVLRDPSETERAVKAVLLGVVLGVTLAALARRS
jgi:hypothetical protein